MKWGIFLKWDILLDIFLLIFSLSWLFLWFGVGYALYLGQAEFIAEELAPRFSTDEDILRSNLQDILKSGRSRRAVVFGTPWAIFSLLLMTRLLADVVKKQRNHTCSGADGNG